MKYPKPQTYRNPDYLEFVRQHHCCMCGSKTIGIVAHHEGLGKNMMGGKPPDTHAVPLCAVCHQLRHHMGKGFWESIDIKMVIIELLTEWIEEND